jgi:hypothetical protein
VAFGEILHQILAVAAAKDAGKANKRFQSREFTNPATRDDARSKLYCSWNSLAADEARMLSDTERLSGGIWLWTSRCLQ